MSQFYVPQDTTALALGADAVANALRGEGVEPTRNGSRGLFWLEPLLEIENDGERIGFGPVTADDIPAILEALAILHVFHGSITKTMNLL